MAIRGKSKQTEHDLVVEASADTFRKTGGSASTNPRNEKNAEVAGLYPDVVAKQENGMIVVEEIETEDSVTQDECENQWKPYSELGYQFNLIVPKDSLNLAQKFIRKAQLKVILQGYTIRGNNVTFYYSGAIISYNDD